MQRRKQAAVRRGERVWDGLGSVGESNAARSVDPTLYAACVARSSSTDSGDLKLFAWRTQEFYKIQPEFRELRKILMDLGGEETAPPLARDPIINFLIDCGIVFNGPVVVKPAKTGEPVTNLARAWRKRAPGLVGIGLGYALEESGLWREHTFGILREGVLEPGAEKRKYFGLMLIGEAADGFATGVLGEGEMPGNGEVRARQ